MQSKSSLKTYVMIIVGVLICLSGAVANATTIVLSTNENETLGGLTFEDEDLVAYNPVTGIGTLFFDGDAMFTGEEDIDAVHILNNGNILLSTEGDATIGGLTFGDDDLVEYNPVTGTASLFFDGGALFSNGFEDIDAVHILNNGNILLSTSTGATIGGSTFEDGDIVEYNPITGIATLFFDEDLFSADEDIDAVHLLNNGNLVISTTGGATMGGLTFEDGDLVEYNRLTKIATLFFDEDLFTSSADINAVYVVESTVVGVPEPLTATLCLIGSGMLIMVTRPWQNGHAKRLASG